MQTFLTSDEMIALTGAKQPEKQRDWLTSHGYIFEVRMDGSNVLLRSYLERKLGGLNQGNSVRKTEPDERALDEIMNHA